MDVGEDSARGDGDSAQKLVELLIVLNGKGNVARGMILLFLLSLAALPASSRISAHKYSRTAVR